VALFTDDLANIRFSHTQLQYVRMVTYDFSNYYTFRLVYKRLHNRCEQILHKLPPCPTSLVGDRLIYNETLRYAIAIKSRQIAIEDRIEVTLPKNMGWPVRPPHFGAEPQINIFRSASEAPK
jgi:hypothetical protein